MATKIRLQRYGRKRKPYYHIVAADTRTKRDGRIIERLGSYDPTTNPATIDIDFDRALYWVKTGAETTDTSRAILSYKGVLMKSHLDRGVLKGAMSQKEADAKFEKWLQEKEAKIQSKADKIAKDKDSAAQERLKAEAEVNAAREKERQEAEAAALAEAQGEEPAAEDAAPEAEAATEEPKAEESKEETPAEEPKAEAKEEAPAEEKTEEPKAEEKAEASEEEEKKEDA